VTEIRQKIERKKRGEIGDFGEKKGHFSDLDLELEVGKIGRFGG
jgi:hypothetical protein